MPLLIELDESQLEDLELFLKLGIDRIGKISNSIKEIPDQIPKTQDVEKVIQPIVSGDAIDTVALIQQIMALYSLKRRTNSTAKEIFDGICFSIQRAENTWNEKKFEKFLNLEQEFIDLLSQPKILHMVKSEILPLDYTNLSRSFKILTDIRPIYSEEADEIVGAYVNYTLRLYYHTTEGHKSLSVVMDKDDVENLRESCNRALKKSKTAKHIFRENGDIEIFERGGREK